MTLHLSDLASVDEFIRLIKGGYISERVHDLDSTLRVYSYTPKTQFGGMWTPETRLTRGLILSVPNGDLMEALVVGRGLPKFFTVEQTDSDWARPKLVDDDENVVIQESVILPWTSPAFVADKLNGALGLAYSAPDGLAISTKGSFGSLEASIGTRIIREKLTAAQQRDFLARTEGSTVLFEIITPERPHPVDYGELEDIVLLGSVEHETGRWTPAATDGRLSTLFGLDVAPRLPYGTLREAVESPYRENTEGLVVTVEDEEGQHLYKVKPSEYLELRKAFYATETVDLMGLMLGMNSDELEAVTAETIPFPKGLRNVELHRKKLTTEVLEPLAVEIGLIHNEYRKLRGDGELPERPAFAASVKASTVQSALLFSAYNEEITGKKSIAAAVLKNIVKELKRKAAELRD
jgi:hypothetical protein